MKRRISESDITLELEAATLEQLAELEDRFDDEFHRDNARRFLAKHSDQDRGHKKRRQHH